AAAVADEAVGGAAGIHEQRDGDAATARAPGLIQAVAQEAAGAQVGTALHAGVDVDVLTLRLPAQAHALGTQGFELAADAVQVGAVAGQGGVDPALVAGRRRSHPHGRPVLDVRRVRVAPLGVVEAGVARGLVLELDHRP